MTLNIAAPKRPKIDYRGIPSMTLIEQVKSTAPFLFEADFAPQTASAPYVATLQRAATMSEAELTALDQDLWGYYELCLSSHFATVGTFVPTDVDLAIRERLWNFVHHESAFMPLWKLIREMLTWDESSVSKRVVWTEGATSKQRLKLSGHQGEWFTVAMAAYGSAKKIAHPHLQDVREAIEEQHSLQAQALEQLEKIFLDEATPETAHAYADGVSAVIHNLGDLDRMFETWRVDDQDVLKRRVFRSGHEDARQPLAVFKRAGTVYQSLLASENHRHFALREPKCLRKSPEFLLNYGPWLDDWGARLVEQGFKTGAFTDRDLRDAVVALVTGWKTLNPKSIYASVGYSRALCGVALTLGDGNFAKGRLELEALVPPIVRRELLEGGLRTLMSVSRAQFEKDWTKKLLRHLSEAHE